jgi:hypothetical protein
MTESKLLRAVMASDLASLHLPWNERLEQHLVLMEGRRVAAPELARHSACTRLPRIAAAPENFFGEGPAGDAISALRVDALSTTEALALEADGWRLVEVHCVWPGAASAAELDDHEHRAQRVAARARGRAWTYSRSTGWGFLYRLPKTP